jgi:CRP-like cAMP-binding protein
MWAGRSRLISVTAPRELCVSEVLVTDRPARIDSRVMNRLLGSLKPGDYDLIRADLRRVVLAHGQVLFEPGDDVHTCYLPGPHTMVSLLIATPAGEEVEAATIGREGAVGGIISAGHKPAFSRAVTTLPGEALSIPIARLEDAKRRSASFADHFCRYADVLLAQVMQSVACNALHSVEQRAARWLLAAHDRAGDDTFHLTQQALADMLGVQRTTVTAVATALQERGLVGYRRANVTVLNRAGLEAVACACHGVVESHFRRLLPEACPSEDVVHDYVA